MQDHIEVSLGGNTYKLDGRYEIIARTEGFSREELEKLRQVNQESDSWRDKSPGIIESLDGKFAVLCSSSELSGIDLVFEKHINEKGEEVYSLSEENRKIISGITH